MERNQIYEKELMVPFNKLSEYIINTFKFTYFDDKIENVKQEVVSFLIEKIKQFDPSKGRAFSYFSIVAKNYLIFQNNTNWKRLRIHDELDALDVSRNFHSEYRETEKNEENKEFLCRYYLKKKGNPVSMRLKKVFMCKWPVKKQSAAWSADAAMPMNAGSAPMQQCFMQTKTSLELIAANITLMIHIQT